MKAWQPEMSQHLLQPMTHGTKVPNMTKPSLILTLSARKSTRLRDLEKKKTFSFLVYHHAHKAITLGRSISESLRIAKDLFDIVLEPMSSGTRCTWAFDEAARCVVSGRFDQAWDDQLFGKTVRSWQESEFLGEHPCSPSLLSEWHSTDFVIQKGHFDSRSVFFRETEQFSRERFCLLISKKCGTMNFNGKK